MTVMAPLLNATPIEPEVLVGHVTESAALMVIAQAVPVAPLASVTWTLNAPEAVGVPVTAPVEAFRLRPAGRFASPPTIENV